MSDMAKMCDEIDAVVKRYFPRGCAWVIVTSEPAKNSPHPKALDLYVGSNAPTAAAPRLLQAGLELAQHAPVRNTGSEN